MENDIKIVEYNPIHVDAINKLENNNLNTRILSENFLTNLYNNDNNYYIMAELNNKIVGYSGMSLLVDHADIVVILIDKNYRNKNIGSKLLNSLISKCKELNLENIFLEVRASNIPAINLYLKLGFKKISERKDYYMLPKENAIIYKKDVRN